MAAYQSVEDDFTGNLGLSVLHAAGVCVWEGGRVDRLVVRMVLFPDVRSSRLLRWFLGWRRNDEILAGMT